MTNPLDFQHMDIKSSSYSYLWWSPSTEILIVEYLGGQRYYATGITQDWIGQLTNATSAGKMVRSLSPLACTATWAVDGQLVSM